MVMLEAMGAAAVAAAKAAEPPPNPDFNVRPATSQAGWDEPIMTRRPRRLPETPQLTCNDEHCFAEAII